VLVLVNGMSQKGEKILAILAFLIEFLEKA